MKPLVVLAFALFSFTYAQSQILAPVSWSYGSKKTSATESILYLKANITSGWHIYSQNIPKGDRIKTIITFSPSKSYRLIGQTLEPKPISKYEDVLSMNISYFEKLAVFQQKIKISDKNPVIKGSIEYMVCNDHTCLPKETVPFSIKL